MYSIRVHAISGNLSLIKRVSMAPVRHGAYFGTYRTRDGRI